MPIPLLSSPSTPLRFMLIWTTLLTAVLADPVLFLDEQLKGYNRAIRPTLAAQGCSVDGFDNVGYAPAEQVEVQLYVSALHSLSQRDMEYMVEGYFRLWWMDQRLALNSNYSETLMNGDPRACGEYANFPAREAASRIWTPDAYLAVLAVEGHRSKVQRAAKEQARAAAPHH